MAESEPRIFTVKTLYELSLRPVVDQFTYHKANISRLPQAVFFDIYYLLYEWKQLCLLGAELRNVNTFSNLLKVRSRYVHLLKMFQAVREHGTRIEVELSLNYIRYCSHMRKTPVDQQKAINLGLRLGQFLCDAGWYSSSEQVLIGCQELCLASNDSLQKQFSTLQCCQKLLHVQAIFYSLDGGNKTFELAKTILADTDDRFHDIRALFYTGFSSHYFVRSEYEEAYSWSIKALKLVTPLLPPCITVDILSQAAKVCIMKREFLKAGLLIREAVYLAKEVFGPDHPKYSDVLLDYGFYLLNNDSIVSSVTVYKTALNIRSAIFQKTNILLALVHEELAYALYVDNYTSGKFEEASSHAEQALSIMETLLPAKHYLQSNAKRVKALILEEMALNPSALPDAINSFLSMSLRLQLSALESIRATFGEMNVQTARHYGNLGRLYQSMKMYQQSEEMHLKAISIKEKLLGPEHHELGLSIGHLASLYTFEMNRYRDAEELYCRSMAIGLKLFGNAYSGLQYDYRGLIHIYIQLGEYDKFIEYTHRFHNWMELKELHIQSEDPPIHLQRHPQPIEDVIKQFFHM